MTPFPDYIEILTPNAQAFGSYDFRGATDSTTCPRIERTDMGSGDFTIETAINIQSLIQGSGIRVGLFSNFHFNSDLGQNYYNSGCCIYSGMSDHNDGFYVGDGVWTKLPSGTTVVYLKMVFQNLTGMWGYYRLHTTDSWTQVNQITTSWNYTTVYSVGILSHTLAAVSTTVPYDYFTLNTGTHDVNSPSISSGTDHFTGYQLQRWWTWYAPQAGPSYLINPLTIPNLISPTNQYEFTARGMLFSWTSVEGATDYRLQLCTDTACDNVAEEIVQGSASVSLSALGLGPFYWRVRAENPNRNGDWSTIWEFTIMPIPNGVRTFHEVTNPDRFFDLPNDPRAQSDIYYFLRGGDDAIDIFVGANTNLQNTKVLTFKAKPNTFTDATAASAIKLPPEHNQALIAEVVKQFKIAAGQTQPDPNESDTDTTEAVNASQGDQASRAAEKASK